MPAEQPGAPAFGAPLRDRLEQVLASEGAGYVPRTRHKREDGSPLYSNRLLLEASPYLRQHAHNPVNWFPWGDEAFALAKQLDRPVLVSIGYSTCHWCHVMEEESFDDVETARFLNQHFIAIKVDREVRPDVDAIYMAAVVALTGRGGWPLNVWLTPDRRPFHGGTYFPPKDRRGRPGFVSVLRSLRDTYASDRGSVTRAAEALTREVRARLAGASGDSSVEPQAAALRRALSRYARAFDPRWGGIGTDQKFPSSLPIRLLLRLHRRTGDKGALDMAEKTLERMAAGGIHDQIGGGFHRYSTERSWLVPHFEKMLYDNALLVLAYLDGAQVTGRADFAAIARKTLDYVRREMISPEGGFYSATDADSPTPEGHSEEGYFFTWTVREIYQLLEEEQARRVIAFYGVTEAGNFEGRNILYRPQPAAQVATDLGIGVDELRESIDLAGKTLYRARALRPPPLRDDKILVGWNGLMIQAFARAGLVLGVDSYTLVAGHAADFLLRRVRIDGRLKRLFITGSAQGDSFLEDYAFLIAGLLDLHEADANPRWLREALRLQAVLESHYADRAGGGYFTVASDHERLLVRQKPANDGAVPTGNSVAFMNLLRLHEITTDPVHLERALRVLSAYDATLKRHPSGMSEMLLALEYLLDTPKQVILVSPSSGAGPERLLATLRTTFLPNRMLLFVREGPDLEANAVLVPLVRGKRARGGEPTAYVCENRVCELPTTDPAVLAVQLGVVAPLPDR